MLRRLLLASASAPWASWSPADKSGNINLSDGNHVATADSTGTRPRAVRSTRPVQGKCYFEFVLSSFAGGNLTIALGLASAGLNVSTQYVGETADSWGLWGRYLATNCRKYNNAVATGSYAGGFNAGVVIGLAVDLPSGRMWWAVNNTWTEGDPAAGTGAAFSNLAGKGDLYAAVSIYQSGDAIRLRANPAEHSYPPPSGFVAGIPG